MGKAGKVEKAAPTLSGLQLGDFKVPLFDGISGAFGARLNQYPPREAIPAQWDDLNGRTPFHQASSGLFFRGGRLITYGLRFKKNIDEAAAMGAIRAWLSSFEPKHEHKNATVAWALSEWCEPTKGGTP